MSRSSALNHLQQLDTGLDNARKRIQEIDIQLKDRSPVEKASEIQRSLSEIHDQKTQVLKEAEQEVSLQHIKLDQNQKKLYSGAVTNPKELEDLQMEASSLTKYIQVLEERQLKAMLEADQSQSDLDAASTQLEEVTLELDMEHQSLEDEKNNLEAELISLDSEKSSYLNSENIPDLPTYESLRNSSGGIAVTLMRDASCSSCGANIPSAIEQVAKSPTNLAFCPTCNRILHPD